MEANGQQQVPSPVPHLACDLTQELRDHISWEWLQACKHSTFSALAVQLVGQG